MLDQQIVDVLAAVILIVSIPSIVAAAAFIVLMVVQLTKEYVWKQRQAPASYVYLVLQSRGLPKELIQHLIQVYIPPEAHHGPNMSQTGTVFIQLGITLPRGGYRAEHPMMGA